MVTALQSQNSNNLVEIDGAEQSLSQLRASMRDDLLDVADNAPQVQNRGHLIEIEGAELRLSDLQRNLHKATQSGKLGITTTKAEDLPGPTGPGNKETLDEEEQRQRAIEILKSLPKNKVSKAFESVSQIAGSELPVVAPALWTDRPKGVKAVDFYREHWASYADKGLTRSLIRQLDKEFYQTLSTWLSRQDISSIPVDLRILLETPSDRVESELAAANITEPLDAFKAFPEDRQKATRLYQAALARRPT